MKKVFKLLIVLTLITAIGLSSSVLAASPVSAKDTLNIAMTSDSGTLAPIAGSNDWNVNVYESLYRVDMSKKKLAYTPCLATSWEFIDSTHMIAKIRKDVVDSAGNKFTAHDVINSFKFALTDLVSAMAIPNIDLEKTKAIDDYTLEIVLNAPNTVQWYLLGTVRLFTKAAMDASPDKMKSLPVGTGPYILTKYIRGSKISLEARQNYWGSTPSVKYVNFVTIPDTTQRVIALKTGQVDIVWETRTSDYAKAKTTAGLTGAIKPGYSISALYFNCSENSIAGNVLFRQAVAYAIDKEAISKIVYNGLFKPSLLPTSSKSWGQDLTWNKKTGYYNRNLVKAKALLAKAGITKGTKVVIGTANDATKRTISEIVQSVLTNNLGLSATIKSYENAVFNTTATNPKNGLDIMIYTTGCPDGYFGNSVRAKMVMSKSIFYKNDEFYKLLDDSFKTNDTNEQLIINKKLNDILVQDVPFYAMTDSMTAVTWNAKLKGANEMLARMAGLLAKDLYFIK